MRSGTQFTREHTGGGASAPSALVLTVVFAQRVPGGGAGAEHSAATAATRHGTSAMCAGARRGLPACKIASISPANRLFRKLELAGTVSP